MPYFAASESLIAIRWFMALVFMTAAVGKMRHWREFSGVLANYRLLPTAFVTPLAYALPPVEAALSVALLAAGRSAVPALTAMILLALFSAAIAINLARGRRDIDCGCFQTHLKQTLRWALVARNAGLIALLAVLAASAASDGSAASAWVTASSASPGVTTHGWATVNGVLAGTAAFLILQSLNTLWAIVPFAPRRVARANASAPRTTP